MTKCANGSLECWAPLAGDARVPPPVPDCSEGESGLKRLVPLAAPEPPVPMALSCASVPGRCDAAWVPVVSASGVPANMLATNASMVTSPMCWCRKPMPESALGARGAGLGGQASRICASFRSEAANVVSQVPACSLKCSEGASTERANRLRDQGAPCVASTMSSPPVKRQALLSIKGRIAL